MLVFAYHLINRILSLSNGPAPYDAFKTAKACEAVGIYPADV